MNGHLAAGSLWEAGARSGACRLHLDITALLVAYDLGILDAVERCFRPLRISPSMVVALLEHLDRLAPPQPSQHSGQQKLLRLVDEGKVQVTARIIATIEGQEEITKRMGQDWVALLDKVKTDGGFIVEYLPVTSNDEDRCLIELPEIDSRYIVNCRSLVDAGLLDLVCGHFRVHVDPRFVEQCHAEAASQEYKNALRTWVRSVVDRVRDGLVSGAFEGISVDDAAPSFAEETADAESPDLRVLRDLLVFRVEPNDVVWIDDRYGSSFLTRVGAPVVGVLELLQELRRRGAITDRDYYDKLLHLRASNARYLPFEADELLHHLRDSTIAQGAVVETPQLSILRRHFAACLLDVDALQRGAAPEGWGSPWGEGAFVFQCVNAVGFAVARCFDEAPLREAARA